MRMTVKQLRAVVAEAAKEAAPGHRYRSPAPSHSPEEEAAAFADMDRRAADRRWEALSRRFPKATSRVGREAFDAEMHHREEGAAGGGSSYGGPAAEFGTLLDLLEKA
jgi:hypothetical protein